jgi:dsRNA-specific ribonuclease
VTAYSFGSRWVGIVAMRDSTSLVPEPLHKMAQRLQKKAADRPVSLDRDRSMAAAAMLRRLGLIRVKYARAGDRARAAECRRAEDALRRGRQPRLRPWLRRELAQSAGSSKHSRLPAPRSSPVRTTHQRLRPRSTSRTELRETGWGDSYPIAPTSPWLPPIPAGLHDRLQGAGLSLEEEAVDWIRWALVHKSYLYESIPDNVISSGTLELLQVLGRNWTRLALLELSRDTRGEFVSNEEVSKVLAQDSAARAAVAKWLLESGASLFGRGESGQIRAGAGSRAPEDVAMQFLGALALTSASTTPARVVLESAGFSVHEPEPDWQMLLRKAAGEPTLSYLADGPDNARTFTATVQAGGRSASGAGRSKGSARSEAHKSWVLAHAPLSVPTKKVAKQSPDPEPFRVSDAHRNSVGWAEQAFGVRAPALFSQALTHRSWTHENKGLVAAARQRDFGVLAAEGSEVLRTLVHHHYVLKTLSDDVAIRPADLIAPSVTDLRTAELYDALDVDQGVLRSSGLSSPVEMRSDVVQALAGAAWRGSPGALARRQFSELAAWVQSFVAQRDSTTALQEYGALNGIEFVYDFETRGPDHMREYRAQLSSSGSGEASLQGGWASGKTPAKHSASGRLLDLLSTTSESQVASEDAALLRACFLEELRAADPTGHNAHQDLLAGRLGLDLLQAGDWTGFEQWADRRSAALPADYPAVLERALTYYKAALRKLLHQRVRLAVLQSLPKHHREDHENEIMRWAASDFPARLALLEELIGTVGQHTDAPTAVAAFVAKQVRTVADQAGTESEVVLSDHADALQVVAKVDGIAMEPVAAPLIDVLGSLVPTASWVFEEDHFAVSIPRSPQTATPLALVGYAAMAECFTDPWLGRVQCGLHVLLRSIEDASPEADEALMSVRQLVSE